MKTTVESKKEIIIKALNMDEMEYFWKTQDAGMMWLLLYFFDEVLVNRIATLPLFWKWWRNQWEIRDAEFIRMTSIDVFDEVLEGKERKICVELYKELNSVEGLKVYPPKCLRVKIDAIVTDEIRKEKKEIKRLINE